MKLIRCTHEPPENKFKEKLIFNSNLNEDLTIDKNSQVALQSITFEIFNKDFVVNSTNSQIIYNIINDNVTYTRTVFLTEEDYRPAEFNDFIRDFTDALNGGLNFISPFMGLEWLVELYSNNHLYVNLIRGQLGTSDLLLNRVVANVNQYTPEVVPIGNNCFMFTRKRFCRGAGYFRIQSVDRTQDFFMGLTQDPFTTTDPNVNILDIRYGLRLNSASNTYFQIVGGVETDTLQVPADNDTIEIHINEGNLEIGFYRTGSNLFVKVHEVLNYIEVSGNRILYPVVCLQNQDTVLENFDFVQTPYQDPQISLGETTLAATNDVLITHLFAPNPGTNDFKFNLEFETLEFAQNCGFLDRITTTVNTQGDVPYLKTPKKFDQNNHNDHFIVELDNVLLKSYDDQKKGRLNILAVTSEKDEDLIFRFRPPYPTFMDIDNANKMSMRNIRMKVLNENLEIIESVGKSVAVLLFKDKDEK